MEDQFLEFFISGVSYFGALHCGPGIFLLILLIYCCLLCCGTVLGCHVWHGLFLLPVFSAVADLEVATPRSSHWLPGHVWCCGVGRAVLGKSWWVLLALRRWHFDTLLSLLRRLWIPINTVVSFFRARESNRYCCRLFPMLLIPARLLFSVTGEIVALMGRFSYTTGPIWCRGSFHHCKRSDTRSRSQWQHIGCHIPKLVVGGWNILIRLVWWN